MPSERTDNSQRYADYRREVAANQIAASLRAGILIVVGLHLPVLALDYAFFRDDFAALAGIRLSNALMLAVFWGLVPRWPVSSMLASLVVAGGHLVAVIAVAGGIPSLYYPAIMLLFLGMPVLLPLTSRQAAVVSSVVFGLFASQPLLGFGEFPANVFMINLLLPGLAAVECVVSCALLDRLKFQDYLRREEIAAARDELAKLDDAKTRFSANVHHELRTPLTLMLAPLDGLREGDYGQSSPAAARVLGTMQSNGQRLLKLINNLLDLAKLENQEFSISRQPLELVDFVEDLIEGTRSLGSTTWRNSVHLRGSGCAGQDHD
jgi:signal transduction histidine kinase